MEVLRLRHTSWGIGNRSVQAVTYSMTFRTATALAIILMGASSATAQTTFQKGDHIRMVGHWDADAERFRKGAPKGEGTGCWRVTGISRTTISTVLVSGLYQPSWSDETYRPGHRDDWFDSPSYVDANPNSGPLSEIGRSFAVVPSCR